MKDYVFTKDAVKLFTNRFGLRLSEKDSNQIDKIEDELIADVSPYLTQEYRITVLPNPNAPLTENRALYLDDVHFGRPNTSFSVTRTLPFEDLGNRFKSEKILQRAESDSLEAQVRRLKHRNYDVVDIGIFSGKTMLEQLNLLRNQGINIDCLVVALAGRNALQSANGRQYLIDPHTKESTGIEVKVPTERIFDWGEWIEVRDLIGLDGRSIKSAGRTYECYSTCLNEQASIPDRHCAAVAEKAACAFERIKGIVSPYGLAWQDTKVEQAGRRYVLRTVLMNKQIMEAP